MGEWWTYRLDDFLLFSPRAYWRLFELHNEASWPLPVLALCIGLLLLALVIKPSLPGGRWVVLLLAIAWAFVGWSFVWERYATINWAATYLAPLFFLQAALLAGAALFAHGLTIDQRGLGRWFGLMLTLWAMIGQPLVAPLQGRPWMAAEVFGMAPDPTAIGTLGLLLLGSGGVARILVAVPLLWCAISAATLWTMGAGEAWIPLVALIGAAATLAAAVARTPSLGAGRSPP